MRYFTRHYAIRYPSKWLLKYYTRKTLGDIALQFPVQNATLHTIWGRASWRLCSHPGYPQSGGAHARPQAPLIKERKHAIQGCEGLANIEAHHPAATATPDAQPMINGQTKEQPMINGHTPTRSQW
jgi:hypothetical protein